MLITNNMKFSTNSIKSCAARIGTLTEFERIPNTIFETPLALIHTKVKFNNSKSNENILFNILFLIGRLCTSFN